MDKNGSMQQHTANLSNVREKERFKKISRHWDQQRDEREAELNRQMVELRHHLEDLEEEKMKHVAPAGAVPSISVSSPSSSHTSLGKHLVKSVLGPHNEITLPDPMSVHGTSSSHKNGEKSGPTSHDVALHILQGAHGRRRHTVHDPKGIAPEVTAHLTDKAAAQTTAKSWHAGRHGSHHDVSTAVQLPTVHDRRRPSAGDVTAPPDHTHGHVASSSKHHDIKQHRTERRRHSMPATLIDTARSKTSSVTSSGGSSDDHHGSHLSPSSSHWRSYRRSSLQDHDSNYVDAMREYFDVLQESENQLIRKDSDFHPTLSTFVPMGTLKRNQRRKLLALEAMLRQMPSFRKKEPPFDPLEVLNCRYLRLSKDNIETLEGMCREDGIDPGIHPHMSADEVLKHFEEDD